MSLDHYSESDQTVSNVVCELTMGYIPPDADIRTQLEQALATIDRLRNEKITAQFTIDQIQADRDFYQQQFADTENRNVWLEEQNETLTASNAYLLEERQWMRGILYNDTINPTYTEVLMSCYEHCRNGEPARIFVGTKARKVGMSRFAYGNALQKLADANIIDRQEDTNRDSKGKNETEITITFPEMLLKYPDKVEMIKEDGRKGNGKGGGKNKKPVTCPECKSFKVEEGKVCYCKNPECGHQWEEGERKDANKHAAVTPWDYGTVEEDATELRAESAAAEQNKDDTTSNMDNTESPPTTLFPEDAPPAAAAAPPAYDGPVPPPDRACFRCNERNWKWEATFEMYLCASDHSVKDVA